jgi:hypothetical protein
MRYSSRQIKMDIRQPGMTIFATRGPALVLFIDQSVDELWDMYVIQNKCNKDRMMSSTSDG